MSTTIVLNPTDQPGSILGTGIATVNGVPAMVVSVNETYHNEMSSDIMEVTLRLLLPATALHPADNPNSTPLQPANPGVIQGTSVREDSDPDDDYFEGYENYRRLDIDDSF